MVGGADARTKRWERRSYDAVSRAAARGPSRRPASRAGPGPGPGPDNQAIMLAARPPPPVARTYNTLPVAGDPAARIALGAARADLHEHHAASPEPQ